MTPLLARATPDPWTVVLRAWMLQFLAASCILAGEARRFDFSRPIMGTTFRVACHADDEKTASAAATAAFARIEELNTALSDYLETSELRRLCATSGSAVPVSPDLLGVIKAAQAVAADTEGAFDITTGHLTNLWRRSRRQKELPSKERLHAAMALADWKAVSLDERTRSVTLARTGMALDLGGIAKGFAADAALAAMRQHGLSRAIVIAGGDMAIGDPPPGQPGWEVKLLAFSKDDSAQDALPALSLRNCGVSTSGDLYQFVEIGGTRYSHIIDPRTGLGLTRRIACSVIAPDATTSDAYATAFCVMGPEKGTALCARHPSLAARWVVLESGGPVETRTPSFPDKSSLDK